MIRNRNLQLITIAIIFATLPWFSLGCSGPAANTATKIAAHRFWKKAPTAKQVVQLADRVAALIDFGFKPVEPPKPGTGTQQTVLRNRDTKPYGATATAADTEQTEEEQKATALKIKNRAQELKGAAPSRLFESCWAQAKSEIVSGAK